MNITAEQITDNQLANLKANAKNLVQAKNDINSRFREFVRQAQKMGYSVNPKTGHIKKL